MTECKCARPVVHCHAHGRTCKICNKPARSTIDLTPQEDMGKMALDDTGDSGANARQVGGDHYKDVNDYQHWDLAADTAMSYHAGNATKYIARHRKKDGVQDLQKALHYTEKLAELASSHPLFTDGATIAKGVKENCGRFVESQGLGTVEHVLIVALATWHEPGDLHEIAATIKALIEVERASCRLNAQKGGVLPGGRTEQDAPFGHDPEQDDISHDPAQG